MCLPERLSLLNALVWSELRCLTLPTLFNPICGCLRLLIRIGGNASLSLWLIDFSHERAKLPKSILFSTHRPWIRWLFTVAIAVHAMDLLSRRDRKIRLIVIKAWSGHLWFNFILEKVLCFDLPGLLILQFCSCIADSLSKAFFPVNVFNMFSVVKVTRWSFCVSHHRPTG